MLTSLASIWWSHHTGGSDRKEWREERKKMKIRIEMKEEEKNVNDRSKNKRTRWELQ